MGPTCDLDRLAWGITNECYYSCPLCDELTSCDWTTCYDDIGFIDYVINHVADYWCIDMNQIHLSGISNGGMYFLLKYWLRQAGFWDQNSWVLEEFQKPSASLNNKLPTETNKKEVIDCLIFWSELY